MGTNHPAHVAGNGCGLHVMRWLLLTVHETDSFIGQHIGISYIIQISQFFYRLVVAFGSLISLIIYVSVEAYFFYIVQIHRFLTVSWGSHAFLVFFVQLF